MVRVLPFLMLLAATAASANPKDAPPPLVGTTEVLRIAPTDAFVDDAIASDGKRLVYVVSNGTASAMLHVWNGGDDRAVDISAVALHPVAIALVGERAFVVNDEDNKRTAALVELAERNKKPAGTVVYKIAAADHVTIDKGIAIVHRATATQAGTSHVVELYDIATGRRTGAGRPFELDASGANAKLDFRVNHWAAGMSRAIGIKGGEWNKKEDQRSPDIEATYDLVAGRFVATAPIVDLHEQRKRYEALAAAGGISDFVRPTWDRSELQLWRDGHPKSLALDQPLATYDLASLQVAIEPTGVWLALKVDPVNQDAVARKKADAEYFDVFRVEGDKATRKARFLAAGVRFRFGVHGDKLWLLERPSGSDRGGKTLAVYELK
jgi:hypothetical protein